TIVQSDIHDFHYNHTRFVILTSNGHEIHQNQGIKFNGYKTTVMVQLPDDRSGALHQVLSAFSWRKLNLTKIESRLMKTGLCNYFFIIDIASKLDAILILASFAELEALKCNVRVLWSYPSFIIDSTTVAKTVIL